jgi:carboxypeptidase Q
MPMTRRYWVALVVAIGFAGSSLALARDKDSAKAKSMEVERIISAGREDSQVMDHLDVLSNRIGPRLTSSDNLTNACEWVRDRFASFGIDNARLEEWGEFPVGFNRGPWFGRVIQPEARGLEFITMAWAAGTKGAVRGKAVLAPTDKKALDEAKQKGTLAGAWVLLPRPRSGAPRPAPEFTRSLKKELEDAKAAGTIQPSSSELLVTGGSHRVSWDKLPTFPSITLERKQFEEITGWLADGKEVTLEFDIRNHFKKGPIKLYNVLADIPGLEFPDEYVIIGGHIDSWDGATGTTDNGTGVATTLEAARILMKAGVKPRRTIRFMLWSGEEQGLLGSRAYVKAHKELMPKISAVIVHDAGTNYLAGIGGTEAMQSDFATVFAPMKELDSNYPFAVSKVPGLFGGGGSDHSSFVEANVPGLFWRQKGSAKYQRTHHTQYDTFDAANADYQKHSSLVAALAAYGIANLDHLLSREKLRVAGGMANRRTLGVELDELTVTEIEDQSAGQKAGLKEGDEILKIDGTKVADRGELSRALRGGAPKRILTVLRAGKEVELTVTWEAPAEKAK